jgi:hypothetical protein
MERERNNSREIWRRSVDGTPFFGYSIVRLSCPFAHLQGHEDLEEERVCSSMHSRPTLDGSQCSALHSSLFNPEERSLDTKGVRERVVSRDGIDNI